MAGPGKRLRGAILGPINEHPLRAAAGIGALLAATLTGVRVLDRASAATGSPTLEATVVGEALLAVSLAHPAYPVAVVVGFGVVLFYR